MNRLLLCLAMSAACLPACSSSDGKSADENFQESVVTGMHEGLLSDIEELHNAAIDLQKAAPDGDGWDDTKDADAIDAMKAAWVRARAAYERTEGAIAPLFPDIDPAIDFRYDDFLGELGTDGDQNLFDGKGVTGMHAIERILYVETTPPKVVTVEESLPGYKAAAWPATSEEAADFKDGLAAQLVTDTKTLLDQWKPQAIDLGGAFQGLVSLMNEQREKIAKAASEEEESRYSQRTMVDIRDNLAGTKKAYALFQDWLLSKEGGKDVDATIEASFASLDEAYGNVDGDALPPVPESWSSENPTEKDLSTDFGKLFTAVSTSVDPNEKGSAVDGMNKAAIALGFPEFAEE
jgi:iron uptake system component EfeO